MKNSTLFSALKVLCVVTGFLTISHFTQAQTLKIATGSANNFILSLGQNLGGTYPAGLSFTFISNQTITGAATINVNGTGVKNLVKNVNQSLVANDILAGQAVQVLYDGTNFQVLSVGSAGSTSLGISSLNGLTTSSQSFSTSSTGTSVNILSSGNTHNFNVPLASVVGGNNITVTGSFPAFTISGTSAAAPTLSLVGNNLSIGGGNFVTLPIVSISGLGTVSVSGTYPNFTITGLGYTSTTPSTGQISAFEATSGTSASSSQLTINSTLTPPISFNNNLNYSSGVLTISTPGIYLLAASVEAQGAGLNNNYFQAVIRKNGSPIIFGSIEGNCTSGCGGTYFTSVAVGVVTLSSGDLITLQSRSSISVTYTNSDFSGFMLNGGGTLTVSSFIGGSSTTGISSLNSLTTSSQSFTTSSTGTSVNIISSGNTHNFNIPLASVVGGNNITVTGSFPLYTVSGLAGSSTATSQWVSTTSGIYYNGGNVGIGTSTPSANLDLGGNVSGNIQAILARGATDPNFNLYVGNGDPTNNAFVIQAKLGLRYVNADAASINFLRGFGATDGSISFNTDGLQRMMVDRIGTITLNSSTSPGVFNAYGNSNFYGNVYFPNLVGATTQALGVNSSGLLVTIPGTSSSITSLNNLTSTSQSFTTSSTGTSVNILSSGNTHNFNVPLASVVGGNNITVTGSFPLYTVSGLASGTSTSQWVSTTNGIFYSGNVGINTIPYGSLQLDNSIVRKKLVLWDGYHSLANTDQFYGIGLGTSTMVYQVDAPTADHVFFAGTSATTSSELMRIKGTGQVGIATSIPGANLDVNGNARFVGPVSITGLAGATTQALGVNNLGQLVTISGGTSTSQWVSTTGGAIFYNGGNVGINGSTYPTEKLYVNGNIGLSIGSALGLSPGSDRFTYGSGTFPNYGIGWYNDTWTGGGPTTYLSGWGGFKFFVSATNSSIPVFSIDYLRNVSFAGSNFTVNSPATLAGPVTISSFAGSGTQALGVNNLGQLVTIAGATSTSQWVSTTGGSIFYNGGNVGIGTATPTLAGFVVNQIAPSNINAYFGDGNFGVGIAQYFPSITFNNYFRGGVNYFNTTGGYASGLLQDPVTGRVFLQVSTTSSTANNQPIPGFYEVLNIMPNGKVGIMNSNPSTSLDVNGNARFTGPVTISGLAGATTQALGVNNLGQLVTISGGTGTSQWVNAAGGIYYGSGNTSITGGKLYLTDFSGTAGGINLVNLITNDTWQTNLTISNTSNTASISSWGLNNAGSGNSQVAPGSFSLYNNNYQFIMAPNGNVGLGSSANARYPNSKLYVEGNASFQGPITISGLATGGATQALGVNNLGQLVTISGTTGTTQWVSDAGGIYYNNGSVSVGTTSNATFAPLSSAKPNGTGTVHTSFGATDGVNSTFKIAHPSAAIGILGVLPGQDLIISTIANDNSAYTPITTFKSNGYVGIATTTPSAFLDVNGNARFTGPVTISGLAGATTQALGVNNLGQLVTITGGTSTSQWTTTVGGSIYYGGTGFVGINSTYPPITNLDVNGIALFRSNFCAWCDGVNVIGPSTGSKGFIIHEGSNATSLNSSTGRYFLGMVSSDPVFNFIGNGLNTSVLNEPNAIAQMTTLSGGTFAVNGRIGIAMPSGLPQTTLDVNGNARFAGPVSITGLATGGATAAVGVNNLGQLVTISGASSAISSLNGLTSTSQNFTYSTTGTSVNIVSSGSTHNFNIPLVTIVGGTNVTVSGGFPSYTITGKPNTPSNWTDSGGDTYHFTGGKVGINTNNPLSRLEVRGNNSSTSTSGAEETVRIGSTDNTNLRLGIWMQTDPNPNNQYMALNAISSGNRSLLLQSTGGNVGIGPATALPNERLTVQGNISTTGTIFAGTIVGNNLIGAAGSIVTVDGLGKLGLGTLPATSSSQWVNSAATTPGIYYTGGKVGIGLPDPTHFSNVPFIVRGATAPQAIFGDNQSGVTITAGNPGIWFNSYFYSGGMRNMIGGYASSLGQNPSTGVFSLNITTATGTANNINPSIVAYNIYPTGNTEFLGLVTTSGLTVKNLIGPGTVTVDGFGRMGVSTTSGGSISGSGTTNGVAFWANGTTITADGANFVYTPSAKSLKVGNAILSSNSLSGNVFFGTNVGNQTMSGTDNNFYGTNIGQSNTSGKSNNFLGNGAGQANNTGSFNNFLGEGTGNANTGGSHNFYAGYQAGGYNISGSNNTYIGQGAGGGISGDGNNYLGQFAGWASTGSYNNFFGSSAGGTNTSGTDNIFIGQSSGLNNTTGSQNVAIGKSAGFAGSNITNGVALGAFATVGGSNMIALGGTGVNAVNVGIGTGLPQNTIDVVGGARIRNLSVSGAVFANASGDLYINTTSSTNFWTITGVNLQSINPSYSINISTSSGYYKYLGYNALSMNINSVSGNSIYLGGAGSLASSGAGNVFIGDLSGINNSSGTNNVFIGLRAGNANSTGSYNTFNGAFAGYNLQNTNFNSFFGYGAGVNSNTGADNTFIGGYAGQTNTSGSGNLALGVQADFTSNNLFQAIAIGYHATVGGSNMMALGGQGVYAVKVGIGTGLPSTTLDVVGGARIRNLSVAGAVFATSNGDLYVNTATSANLWTVSGTSLTPSTTSYGVNVGTNVTTTGLVNISSTTNSGMVISSYSIPANTGALMVNSYSSSTAGIGGFVTGPNAVGIYGQATNGLSSAIEGNNTGGGSAIRATGLGAVSPVVQIDNNGSGGTGLRINLSQGSNTATGLMIISSSTTTSQAMDISGKIQFRNYTSGTLTVDGLGNLGVSTATSNVGAGSGFLATSTVPQANISSGVWTLALFGNEVFDDASKYDNTTTFDYTAPANGVYQINASVPFSNIGQVDIAIAVNAVNMIVNSASTSPNTGIITSIPISGILKLTSGQKVTIQVRQFTGGLVGTASSNTGANASFSMVKLY